MKGKLVIAFLCIAALSGIRATPALALSEISVSSATVDFGAVFDSKTETLIVKNEFLRRVHLGLDITQGASGISFSVQPSALNLSASETATVVITALQTSTALGPKTASMRITGSVDNPTGLRPLHENEGKTVTLKGAIEDFFDGFPQDGILNFGTFNQGTDAVKSITLKARTNINLTFAGVTPPFAIDAPSIVPLATGNQVVVKVTLPANTQPGAFNNTIAVTASVQKPIPPTHPVEQIKTFLASATITQPAQPDLSPQILGTPTVTPPQGGANAKIKFQLKVNNSGAASVACDAKIFLNGNRETTITIPAIGANSSNTQNVSFGTGKSGQVQMTLKVDTNDANAESNENNNEIAPVTLNIP